jgi:hypothetical protein
MNRITIATERSFSRTTVMTSLATLALGFLMFTLFFALVVGCDRL